MRYLQKVLDYSKKDLQEKKCETIGYSLFSTRIQDKDRLIHTIEKIERVQLFG